jgi:riboflavin-specific deaminase-like protein
MMDHPRNIRNIDHLLEALRHLKPSREQQERPFVLISYAQSIDGSIATLDRRPLRISGTASMTLTHRLRSLFDGILVGIDTVLADDPQLNVRLVQGSNPQPVVLDTHLRIPLRSRLLQGADCPPWLASSEGVSPAKGAALRGTGAIILPCPLDDHGQIEIRQLMNILHGRGIRSLMVEGGAKVITSFIHAGLVDLFVITISPTLIGGLWVVQGHNESPLSRVNLADIHYERLEDDLILWARPDWNHK